MKKMKKITIFIPKTEEKWKFVPGSGVIKRQKPEVLLKALEKNIFRFIPRGEKARLVVRGTYDTTPMVLNESCSSDNPKDLMWTAVCFLEDFLDERFLKNKLKLYQGEEP